MLTQELRQQLNSIESQLKTCASEEIDALWEEWQQVNAKYEEVAKAFFSSLDGANRETESEVNWETNDTGTVGTKNRRFKINSVYAEVLIIEVLIDGTWISSQWRTTQTNKYIQAIRESVPAHRKSMTDGTFISKDVRERRVFSIEQIQAMHQHPGFCHLQPAFQTKQAS